MVSPSRSGPVGASEYNRRGAPKIMATASPIDQSGGSVGLVLSEVDGSLISVVQGTGVAGFGFRVVRKYDPNIRRS